MNYWAVVFDKSNIILSFIVFVCQYNVNTSTTVTNAHSKFDIQTKQSSFAFGGVLNSWITGVLSNDTEARRAVKFAVKYARKHKPEVFPAKADVKYTHYAREMSKMKLMYTSDNQKPAMYNMMDPVQLKPVYVPIVWGILYTFNIFLVDPERNSKISHYFTVLEYIDEQFYILEHSYYCQHKVKLKENPDLIDFHPFRILCSTFIHNITEDNNSTHQVLSNNNLDISSIHEAGLSTNSEKKSNTSSHSSVDTDYPSENDSGNQSTISTRFIPLSSNIKMHFSILTYNVWNSNVVHGGDLQYIKRMQHLAQIVRESRADIVAFQEMRFEDGCGGVLGPNQLWHLSKLLQDYQFVYQPGQVQQHGLPNMIIEGVAIFARHPIVNRQHILLTRNPGDGADGHQRVLLHAEIDLPLVGTVHVLNTHLSLSHAARLVSVQEIWEYSRHLVGPTFLAGDFNAEAHNEEVRFLGGKLSLGGTRTYGFHDTWELHHGSHDKGFTFNTLEPELSKRIDLLFMRELRHLALADVQLVDDKTRGSSAASDHLGLLARFGVQVQPSS